jgi:hypothetical protein
MSYDLAVWEGDRPPNDLAAAAEIELLFARYVDVGDYAPPTLRIAGYVNALLDRYPDIDSASGKDSPWSTAPLINEARGPLIYFPMKWGRSDEVSAWAAALARQHELNCFDPQWGRLRT